MVQATTPTFIFTLPSEIDLSQAENVYVTIKQVGTVITKKGSAITIDANKVYVTLTQAETVRFVSGNLATQLNWTYENGIRAASNIVVIPVTPNLLQEVVE